MKGKLFRFLVVFLFLFGLFAKPTFGQEEKRVSVYFFWSQSCPHCLQEKTFLNQLIGEDPQIELKSFEISDQEGHKLLQEIGELIDVSTRYVPFTVVGRQHFVGYSDDATSGEAIKKAIFQAEEDGCYDIFTDSCFSTLSKDEKTSPEVIKLPLLGKTNIKNISLPVLTVIIGVLDGFNPCAMWTLIFLITLLLGMKDRKRMWILGIAFIGTSAFVYFLFMAAWLNFFLFLGFVSWVRIVIGLLALGAGVYSLRDYHLNKDGACKVTGGKKRQRVLAKMEKITQRNELILALMGIILLAFAVNLVELVCSAGLPAIYTQVLTFNNLPPWQYYSYLLLYVFFFMIDDLFVFFIAMKTLDSVNIKTKYARFSRLIGGILMLIVGLLMILKPEWLMFG